MWRRRRTKTKYHKLQKSKSPIYGDGTHPPHHTDTDDETLLPRAPFNNPNEDIFADTSQLCETREKAVVRKEHL